MKQLQLICAALLTLAVLGSCGKAGTAWCAFRWWHSRVFVKPGDKDKFYLFASGGFSGQLGVNGLPFGCLLRVIPGSFLSGQNRLWVTTAQSRCSTHRTDLFHGTICTTAGVLNRRKAGRPLDLHQR